MQKHWNEAEPSFRHSLSMLSNLVREQAGIPQYGNGTGMIVPPTSRKAYETLSTGNAGLSNCESIRYQDIRRLENRRKL